MPSRRIRVGHNLLGLHSRMVGVRVYTTNLLAALMADPVGSKMDHTVFVSNDGLPVLEQTPGVLPALAASSVRIIQLPFRGTHRPTKVWWEQFRLPRLAAQHGLDVLHSYDFGAPIRLGIPQSVTIHDLRYLEHPAALRLSQRVIRAALIPRAVRTAAALVTISQYTRHQIIKTFGVASKRCHVVPDAPTPFLGRPADVEALGRLGVRRPYLLSVGTVTPHKNLERLVRVFARLSRADLQLVIAGRSSGHSSNLAAAARQMGVADNVCLTGFVMESELATLYKNAAAFVMPSLYEGFGIPVLEAMRFGLPVASSTAGALPEVAGDAARFFDPLDLDGMFGALRDVLENEALRERLRVAGRRRCLAFTWADSASRLSKLLTRLPRQRKL